MARILMVDDDPDFVEAVRLHLERAGHAVQCAYDRPGGMRLAREGQFDLLILDVMMNDLDDALSWLRSYAKRASPRRFS